MPRPPRHSARSPCTCRCPRSASKRRCSRPPAKRRQPRSAPAHEGDDLVIVAILDLYLPERGAGNDLEVALHGDASRLEAEVEGELGDGDPLGDPAVLAVDGDRKGVVVNHVPPYSVSPCRRYPSSMCSMGRTSTCSA